MVRDDDDDLVCGIDGEPEEPITVRTFNRWLAFAVHHHIKPAKDIANMNNELLKSAQADLIKLQHTLDLERAEWRGGLTIIKFMFPIGQVILALVVWLMGRAGMLT